LLIASPAKGDSSLDTFTYQVTVPQYDPYPNITTMSWQAESSPDPISFCAICDQFTITTNLMVNGTDIGPTLITFGTGGGKGAFEIPSLGVVTYGANPWAGAEYPTFFPGTYSVTLSDITSPTYTTLTVTPTPEPSTLSLLFPALLGCLFFASLSKGFWVR
jgi:hypothetical protein